MLPKKKVIRVAIGCVAVVVAIIAVAEFVFDGFVSQILMWGW